MKNHDITLDLNICEHVIKSRWTSILTLLCVWCQVSCNVLFIGILQPLVSHLAIAQEVTLYRFSTHVRLHVIVH